MVSSKAKTVADYLKELPADRRKEISKVRSVVRTHLPRGYEESMLWGMIAYTVPMKVLPDTYNKQPLCYAALAAQKNFNTLYLMSAYGTPENAAKFRKDFEATGKKLDIGKSCVHFQSADDLPLDFIGRTIAAVSMDRWIEIYRQSRTRKKS